MASLSFFITYIVLNNANDKVFRTVNHVEEIIKRYDDKILTTRVIILKYLWS